MKPGEKVYLGDGAYLTFDGEGYALTAENGIVATDRVYLEPAVLGAFATAVGLTRIELETVKNDALEFAAQLCEVKAIEYRSSTEEFSNVRATGAIACAEKIRSRKGG